MIGAWENRTGRVIHRWKINIGCGRGNNTESSFDSVRRGRATGAVLWSFGTCRTGAQCSGAVPFIII